MGDDPALLLSEHILYIYSVDWEEGGEYSSSP